MKQEKKKPLCEQKSFFPEEKLLSIYWAYSMPKFNQFLIQLKSLKSVALGTGEDTTSSIFIVGSALIIVNMFSSITRKPRRMTSTTSNGVATWTCRSYWCVIACTRFTAQNDAAPCFRELPTNRICIHAFTTFLVVSNARIALKFCTVA